MSMATPAGGSSRSRAPISPELSQQGPSRKLLLSTTSLCCSSMQPSQCSLYLKPLEVSNQVMIGPGMALSPFPFALPLHLRLSVVTAVADFCHHASR